MINDSFFNPSPDTHTDLTSKGSASQCIIPTLPPPSFPHPVVVVVVVVETLCLVVQKPRDVPVLTLPCLSLSPFPSARSVVPLPGQCVFNVAALSSSYYFSSLLGQKGRHIAGDFPVRRCYGIVCGLVPPCLWPRAWGIVPWCSRVYGIMMRTLQRRGTGSWKWRHVRRRHRIHHHLALQPGGWG